MLSVSGENKSSSDDISFMHINASTGEVTNIKDIYVSINGQPIPLPKQQDVYIDQRTNKQYPVIRTLFEIDENMLTRHSSVRR